MIQEKRKIYRIDQVGKDQILNQTKTTKDLDQAASSATVVAVAPAL